jgi:transcriptional regulator with GAF, ATPase, and Fis domain
MPMTQHSETTGAPSGSSSQSLLDRDKLLQSIFRISTLLTAPVELDRVLKRILDEVVDAVGFDRGIIRLLDASKRFLETKVAKNYTPEEEARAFAVPLNLAEHDCVSTKVAKTGAYLAIEDAAVDPRMTETDRMLTRVFHGGSILCAPLKIERNVIGVLAAWRGEKTRFFPEEIDLFLSFASQASIVIHNARLLANHAEKIRELTLLQEAVSEMNFSYDLDNHILNVLISSALKIGKADRVVVYILDIEANRCMIHDGEHQYIEDKEEGDIRLNNTIIQEALAAKETRIRSVISGGEAGPVMFDGYPHEIAIPLDIQDKFKGALYLAKRTEGFSSDQINVFDILARNAAVAYDNAIMHSKLSLEAKSLKTEVEKLKEREDRLLGFHNILGTSQKMIGIFHIIREVAAHDTNILVQGESGTGKELMARAIHRQSNRHAKPFVDVNCAAIPGTLLESELFGYEAGAFTDARKRKIGLLEYASGGTILLDEIGDMSIHLQAKFLRMLEDGHIRRLGGNENIPIDVRFIFATNRDLGRMVTDGIFRDDLYYRISVVPVVIPPLREREDDILLLAKYYLDEFNRKFKKRIKGFSLEAEGILRAYQWPGNVRELRNIIERVMILQQEGTMITPEHLPGEIKMAVTKSEPQLRTDILIPRMSPEGIHYDLVLDRVTSEVKRKLFQEALNLTKGNMTAAARLLGISRYKFIREQKKLEQAFEEPVAPGSGPIVRN